MTAPSSHLALTQYYLRFAHRECKSRMPLFRVNQILRGRLGQYTITKEIRNTVCFARNEKGQRVVVKGVEGHPRVENERDVLKHFHGCHSLRPLIDEVQVPVEPSMIILRYLDDDLLNTSIRKSLNRKEIKHVSRRILHALDVLHRADLVHTDVKPDNVFVNFKELGEETDGGEEGMRFSDAQLGDLGGTCAVQSEIARSGTPIGAPIWASPEVIMETRWNTATDIWSFGTLLISLIYGGKFNLFRPRGFSVDHEEYSLEILKKQFRYFGPFLPKYSEIANPETVTAILWLMEEIPGNKMTPFSRTVEAEVCQRDKEFIGKIMQMDWRDRPSASQLLEDTWFSDT